ncbi:YppE family protein [Thalassorhabdus alkalitolerans]|uniref:YppE family protein n=1 Tax=Thalassorhabdus alkalitolerans TaxID=2282697 RepID=A0ABW0YV74_9BACI
MWTKEDTALLHSLTKEVKQWNEKALKQYEQNTLKEGYSPDFYGQVKPFADHVKEAADKWRQVSERWIEEEKPKYIYKKQVTDTHENLTILSVTAFQIDTKSKRFHEMVQSVDYVLEGILYELKAPS